MDVAQSHGKSQRRPWSERTARLQGAGLVGALAITALYVGSAQLSYRLDFAGPVAAIMWLPAGVGIAGLYLRGLAMWPAVLVGDLLVNDYGALPLGSALGQTAGNVLAVVAAAWLLGAVVRRRGELLGSAAALAGMMGALAVGSAVSATVGGLSLWLGDVTSTAELATVWRTWWLGDVTGALVIVTLAVAWLQAPARRSSGATLEAAAVLIVVAALTQVAFKAEQPMAYVVLPALAWAALRLSLRAATLAVTLTVALAVRNTVDDSGTFANDSMSQSVLYTQVYIAVAALSTLCIAAVVREREALARRLGAAGALALRAADEERSRIERDLHDGVQQRLLALVVQLRLAAERARDAPEQASALFARAEAELHVAVDELRELAEGIHSDVLTTLGLAAAIESLVARSAVPMATVTVPAGRFDPVVEATAYRLVAEAVANVERHAGARSITITVEPVGAGLRVEVLDDGVGGAHERPGSALDALRQRVELGGGSLRVHSPRGRGTRVCATVHAAGPDAC